MNFLISSRQGVMPGPEWKYGDIYLPQNHRIITVWVGRDL